MYLEGNKIRELVCVQYGFIRLSITVLQCTVLTPFSHHNEIDNDSINNKKIPVMKTENKMRIWTFSSCLKLYQNAVL